MDPPNNIDFTHYLPTEIMKYILDRFLCQEDKFLLSWTCHSWRKLIRDFYGHNYLFNPNEILCYAAGNGYLSLMKKMSSFPAIDLKNLLSRCGALFGKQTKIDYLRALEMAAKYHQLESIKYILSLISSEFHTEDGEINPLEKIVKQSILSQAQNKILEFSAYNGFMDGLKFCQESTIDAHQFYFAFLSAAKGRQLKMLEYLRRYSKKENQKYDCAKALLYSVRGNEPELKDQHSGRSFPKIHRDSRVTVMTKLEEWGNLIQEAKLRGTSNFSRVFLSAVSRCQIKAIKLLMKWNISLTDIRLGFLVSVGTIMLNPEENLVHKSDLLVRKDSIPDEKHYRLSQILFDFSWSNDINAYKKGHYCWKSLVIASAVNRVNIFKMINHRLIEIYPEFQFRAIFYQKSVYWAAFYGSLQIVKLFNQLGLLSDFKILENLIHGAIEGGQVSVINLIHSLIQPDASQYHEMMLYLCSIYTEKNLTSEPISNHELNLKFEYQVENLQTEWIKMASLLKESGATDYNQYFHHSINDDKLRLLQLFGGWDQFGQINVQMVFNQAASKGQIESMKLIDSWGVGYYLTALKMIRDKIKNLSQRLEMSQPGFIYPRVKSENLKLKRYQECHVFLSLKIRKHHDQEYGP